MVEGIVKTAELESTPKNEVRSRDYSYLDKQRREDSDGSEIYSKEDEKNKGTDVKVAVERIENAAHLFSRKLKFEIEKDLDVMVVKIIDGETEEVIRQIPPEELIELSKRAKDLKGLLLDKEV